MKTSISVALLMALMGFQLATHADDKPPIRLETLMKSVLELDDELEITISSVEIGPHLELPKHYHPGEEFIYVLEGSATVWQQDGTETVLGAGEAYRIPLEQVHSASTTAQPAKAIVFRVHRRGQPERVLVE